MQALEQDVQPPADGQRVVRALGSRGGNAVEVEDAAGRRTLVLMPAKFNKKLWVRRGGYLIVDESEAAAADAGSRAERIPVIDLDSCRVTGTIVAVLYNEHVRQLQRMPGVWPAEFLEEGAGTSGHQQDSGSGDDDGSGGGLGTARAAARPPASPGAADGGGRGTQEDASDGNGDEDAEEGGLSEDSLEPPPQNSNRRVIYYEVSDTDTDEDEEEQEGEDDGDDGEGQEEAGQRGGGAGAREGSEMGQRQGGAGCGGGTVTEQQPQQERQSGRLTEEEVDQTLEELGQQLAACELGERPQRGRSVGV